MSSPCAFPELADRPYDGEALLAALEPLVDRLVMDRTNQSKMRLSTRELRGVLDGLPGDTLQERWSAFEWRVWPDWLRGVGRAPHDRWTLGRVRADDLAGRPAELAVSGVHLHPRVGETAAARGAFADSGRPADAGARGRGVGDDGVAGQGAEERASDHDGRRVQLARADHR